MIGFWHGQNQKKLFSISPHLNEECPRHRRWTECDCKMRTLVRLYEKLRVKTLKLRFHLAEDPESGPKMAATPVRNSRQT